MPSSPDPPRLPKPADAEPFVIVVTDGLSSDTVAGVAQRIQEAAPTGRTVIDVTAVPSLDSDGIAALLALRGDLGADRLVVVGLREAGARLAGTADLDPGTTPHPGPTHIPMRALAGLVMLAPDDVPPASALRDAMVEAVAADCAIVVLDMAWIPTPSPEIVAVLCAAGGDVAVHGQELVLVNVSREAAMSLRRAGLAPTTYLATVP